MPYTKSQLLSAIRSDHPEFAKVSDDDLFNAVNQDHPELTASISQAPDDRTALQVMRDQATNVLHGAVGDQMAEHPIDTAIATAKNAVKHPIGTALDAFRSMITIPYHGIAGAADAVKSAVPGGMQLAAEAMPFLQDRSSLPQASNEQMAQGARGAGQFAAAVPVIAGEVGAAKGALQSSAADVLRARISAAIPNAQRAGANLNTVMEAAKDIPIDTTAAGNAAMRADELAKTGASLPKVIRDYINKFPADSVMNYDVGRDFATNAGALSASEKMAMNSPMGRQVGIFAQSLKDANRAAAVQAGMGDLYDSAISEYRKAMQISNAKDALVDAVKKYGPKAALIGAGYGIYKELPH